MLLLTLIRRLINPLHLPTRFSLPFLLSVHTKRELLQVSNVHFAEFDVFVNLYQSRFLSVGQWERGRGTNEHVSFEVREDGEGSGALGERTGEGFRGGHWKSVPSDEGSRG
jgi:hypothetical protein